MKVGSRILMNDGEVELIVEKISAGKIETKVKTGGNISSHKGELTRAIVRLPAITEKDKKIFSFF